MKERTTVSGKPHDLHVQILIPLVKGFYLGKLEKVSPSGELGLMKVDITQHNGPVGLAAAHLNKMKESRNE